MRKAILVLATSVAFLVSGAAFAVTGSRTATVTSAADLVTKGTLTDAAGNLRVQSPVSGVYIPAGASASTEVAVAARTAGTIAKSAVSTAVKAAVRANGAVVAVNGAIAAATAAVGWIQNEGSYVKKTDGAVSTNPNNGEYYWTTSGYSASSPGASCSGAIKADGYSMDHFVITSDAGGDCYYRYENSVGVWDKMVRKGSSCPSGSTYNTSMGTCYGSGTTSLTEADYNDLGDWVQQQDGTYVRQAAIEGCYLSVNPESCFQSVVPDRALTGPSVVTGTPTTTSKTVTVTQADGSTTTGTSTTTTTPSSNVTYNNNTTNNINFNTYDQTSTKNPDGSTTETTTDEGPPNVPDLTSTAFGPLDGLPADIASTGATGSSLPFLAWFSMGGQCREHTFQLPVVGALTTNYCPIHEAYVRPFLYFIFSVWTFIYCFQIWRESTVRVRIM